MTTQGKAQGCGCRITEERHEECQQQPCEGNHFHLQPMTSKQMIRMRTIIVYCPLHANAADLLEAARRTIGVLGGLLKKDCPITYKELIKAIAAAEKGGSA